MEDFVHRFLSIRIGGQYQLLERIGEGTFGIVYLGYDTVTHEEVAIKLEHYSVVPSLVDQEVEIYKTLRGRPGFPQVFWHGSQDDFRVMVFELLGPNLEDLFRYCGNRFSVKTTSMLMHQLLRRLESFHQTGHHHRDIKPENFMLGTGRKGNVVYMTDLGLASYRLPSERQNHFRERAEPPQPALIGTCRYASINGHLDVPPSCRDDLESIGYMALYFLRGSLPWQGLQISDQEGKYARVLELKQQTGVDALCKDLPPEFATYMNYLRQMENPDRPDYRYLRRLFGGKRLGFENNNQYDWTIREFERLSVCQPSTSETSNRGPARASPRRGKARHRCREESRKAGTTQRS